MATTKTTITRNQMTSKQSFQLANWVLSNVDSIKGKTRAAIAAKAAKDLGFNVSDANVTSALKTTDTDIGRSYGTKGDRTNRVVIVAQEMISLLEQLGHPVSDRLKFVASNSRRKA